MRRISTTRMPCLEPTHLPAMSTLRIACGMENPSYTGTACVTPSPESSTIPVVRPEEYLVDRGVSAALSQACILSRWTVR